MDDKPTKKEELLGILNDIVYENIKEFREEFYEVNIKVLQFGFNITTIDKEKYD